MFSRAMDIGLEERRKDWRRDTLVEAVIDGKLAKIVGHGRAAFLLH